MSHYLRGSVPNGCVDAESGRFALCDIGLLSVIGVGFVFAALPSGLKYILAVKTMAISTITETPRIQPPSVPSLRRTEL